MASIASEITAACARNWNRCVAARPAADQSAAHSPATVASASIALNTLLALDRVVLPSHVLHANARSIATTQSTRPLVVPSSRPGSSPSPPTDPAHGAAGAPFVDGPIAGAW